MPGCQIIDRKLVEVVMTTGAGQYLHEFDGGFEVILELDGYFRTIRRRVGRCGF